MKSSHLLKQRFDHEKLDKELDQIIFLEQWTPHFNTEYYSGLWKGIVVIGSAKNGQSLAPDKEGTKPQLLFDKQVLQYTLNVLESFDTTIISARYLNLHAGSSIKEHKDPDLDFWNGLVRLHIPIRTNNMTSFIIDGKKVEMQEGECWFANFSKAHSVTNQGNKDRIHLVIDLQVNEKIKECFINEGILEHNEREPDPISLMTKEEKNSMIESLEALGTETAKAIIKDLNKRNQ